MTKPFLKISVGLILLLATICLAPIPARAETVGFILTQGGYDYERIHSSLESYIKKKGYEGKIKFLAQRPYPDTIALSNAARKLIAADVDVIITYGASSTIATAKEKPDMPILYAGVYEPIVSEIKSRQAAGICSKLNVSSLVRYLRGSATVKNLGVVYSSMEIDSKYQMTELKQLAGKYGFALVTLDLKNKANFSEQLNAADIDALIVTSSDTAGSVLPTILRVSTAKKLPTASLITGDKVSAMITLTSDADDLGEKLGQMLIDAVGGKSAQSIGSICSRKIELVYNVKEANRMGLKISMDLVTEATKLINQ